MGDINEAMANQAAPEEPTTVYPAGADVLNADNVRHYPELFTDEQIASIPTDELPESDLEKHQREQAEAAEAAAKES
jgi:hypothetical protein